MEYDGRGSKVMVAESDRAVLEMLQIRLDVAGYHAISARNGATAIEMLQHVRPSALVLELNLPDLDGFAVLEHLNLRMRAIPLPTLVVGRQLAVADIKRAMNLGARDCMAKPFSGADVLDRLKRLICAPAPSPERATAWV